MWLKISALILVVPVFETVTFLATDFFLVILLRFFGPRLSCEIDLIESWLLLGQFEILEVDLESLDDFLRFFFLFELLDEGRESLEDLRDKV